MQYIENKIKLLSNLNTQIENLRSLDTIPAVLMKNDGCTEQLVLKDGKLVLVGMENDCICSVASYGRIILTTQGYKDWGEYIPCSDYYFVKLGERVIDMIIKEYL